LGYEEAQQRWKVGFGVQKYEDWSAETPGNVISLTPKQLRW
jgi:hypothetical protein